LAGIEKFEPRISADEARIIHSVHSPADRLLHKSLTEQIIGAAFAVHTELGPGFLEKVYETALLVELTDKGCTVETQAQIPVYYRSRAVGLYYADLLVDDKVICEIKAAQAISLAHQAQLLHYLKATGLQLGLILNFGIKSLQFKRLAKSK
jgi:GxxExxY protein